MENGKLDVSLAPMGRYLMVRLVLEVLMMVYAGESGEEEKEREKEEKERRKKEGRMKDLEKTGARERKGNFVQKNCKERVQGLSYSEGFLV